MVLALDHLYTDSNFSSAQLKGNDRVRVATLRRAATLAGMEIRVGLIEETVSAEWLNGDAIGQRYGSGYYGSYAKDEEGDPEHFDEIEVGDPLVEELNMGDWLDEDGPQLGSLQLRHTEILTGPGQQRGEPIEWSVEGYMGNWGMTADYVYRHAGVVIWHPSATPPLLERLPLDGRVSWTVNWSHQLASSPEDDGLRQRIEVLQSTVEKALSATYTLPSDTAAIAELLAILGRYSSPPTELFRRWEPILERLITGVPPGLWGPQATTFGWEAVDRVFRSVGVREPRWHGAEDMTRLSKLIESTRILAEGQDEGHHRLAQGHLHRLPDYLQVQFPQGKVAREVLAGLLILTRRMAPEQKWLRRVGDYLLRPIDDATYFLHSLGEELIHNTCPSNPLYAQFYQATLNRLRQRLQHGPQPFADYARARSQAISASVDALLDTWEAQLDRRYQSGTNAGYIPDLYPTLDHLSQNGFAAVEAEME